MKNDKTSWTCYILSMRFKPIVIYVFGKITNKIKQIERFGEPQKNLPGVKKSNHAWLSILELIKVSSGKLHMVNAFTNSNLIKLIRKCKVFISCTAQRIQERREIQTSSSFVKIWLVCIPEFKANFLFFLLLYGLAFDLETIGVH